jgi:hypothetical protein
LAEIYKGKFHTVYIRDHELDSAEGIFFLLEQMVREAGT